MAIVAICRGSKAYGTQLAECLAGKLDYPVVGEEVVQDAAERLGVSVEDLQERMGSKPSLWEPFSAMRRTYLVALQTALAEHIVDGNLVYHGITGGLLLADAPTTLTVRCVAPLGMRIRTVMQESEMDWGVAERYIRDLDEARSRWVKVIHGTNLGDPDLYDLVLNLEHLSVEAACDMISAIVAQPEFEYGDDVRAGLRDFLTASRVRLALVEDERLRPLELNAAVDGGTVTISGTAPVRARHDVGDRITEAARAVPGVDDIHLQVEWFDPYP